MPAVRSMVVEAETDYLARVAMIGFALALMCIAVEAEDKSGCLDIAGVKRFAGSSIVPARLRASWVGLQAPVASNVTEDGRAKNRRVELLPQ